MVTARHGKRHADTRRAAAVSPFRGYGHFFIRTQCAERNEIASRDDSVFYLVISDKIVGRGKRRRDRRAFASRDGRIETCRRHLHRKFIRRRTCAHIEGCASFFGSVIRAVFRNRSEYRRRSRFIYLKRPDSRRTARRILASRFGKDVCVVMESKVACRKSLARRAPIYRIRNRFLIGIIVEINIMFSVRRRFEHIEIARNYRSFVRHEERKRAYVEYLTVFLVRRGDDKRTDFIERDKRFGLIERNSVHRKIWIVYRGIIHDGILAALIEL